MFEFIPTETSTSWKVPVFSLAQCICISLSISNKSTVSGSNIWVRITLPADELAAVASCHTLYEDDLCQPPLCWWCHQHVPGKSDQNIVDTVQVPFTSISYFHSHTNNHTYPGGVTLQWHLVHVATNTVMLLTSFLKTLQRTTYEMHSKT